MSPPANGLVEISADRRTGRIHPLEDLAFQSIASLGNEPVALLGVKTPRLGHRSHRLVAGDWAFGYRVKAIAKDHVILVRGDTAAEIKIPLASAPVIAGDAKPYSKAWINSPANPMLHYAQHVHGRMFGGVWDKLTDEGRAQILEFYRKHGWQLITTRNDPGPGDFEWRNLTRKSARQRSRRIARFLSEL